MEFEGGFQGRTNKLVDGCYSFWCGAIVPIVQAIISKKGMANQTSEKDFRHLRFETYSIFRTILESNTQETGF